MTRSLLAVNTLSLRISEQSYYLLDQTLLPNKEVWTEIKNVSQMVEAIKSLRIRGAPLIGVSSVLYIAFESLRNSNLEYLRQVALELRQARPTAVNLMNNIDDLLAHFNSVESLVTRAIKIFHEDQKSCQQMGVLGSEFIKNGDSIITHCNTGSLATAGDGTALSVIKHAHRQGKKIHVYVDETRPLWQGARLTSWELEKEEIPHTLITDSMAAFLMKQGLIQCAFVGCDRVAVNGDFANKIGTYSLAVNCLYHQIPFYVVGPLTTWDKQCETGDDIPVEQRTPLEVSQIKMDNAHITIAPKSSNIYNPSFDITPAKLVSAWINENEIIKNNRG